MRVVRATMDQLPDLVPLFDGYRQFYGRPADEAAARQFLAERIANEESVIFVATEVSMPALGFVQLYPSFSSVAGRRRWILNDLYVTPAARRRGVGRALMAAALALAEASGADGLSLETATDNTAAQALYESLGYRREDGFYSYFLPVDPREQPDGSRDEG